MVECRYKRYNNILPIPLFMEPNDYINKLNADLERQMLELTSSVNSSLEGINAALTSQTSQQETTVQDMMFCPECGAQIPVGSKFCGQCGSRIELQTQPEEEEVQKPRIKKLYISVGGQRGQMLRFHRLSPDNELYERAQELIEEGDQSEIEEFVDNFEQEDFEYDIQPLNDSGMTWVRVTDEDGNVIFDDEVEVEQRRFNGNPHNWRFDDSVSVTLANRIKSLIDERFDKAYANYADEADCTDEEKCRNDFWEEECDIADVITTEMLTDVLKVNSEKDSDDIYYIWGGDLYGFSYGGEILLPEDEDFDIEKLRLFLHDYDGFGVNFNGSDCWDSVLPVIQYGNTFSQLYIEDWEIHYSNAAFCSIEYGTNYLYLKFLNEEKD